MIRPSRSAIVLAVSAISPSLAVASSPASGSVSALDVGETRVDDVIAPLGLDDLEPRFAWTLDSVRSGERQTAFQVEVASTPKLLEAGVADVWDSRRVSSAEQAVVYGGGTAASRRRYVWRVRVWDAEGRATPWSRPHAWETGLLNKSDWQAGWIRAGGINGVQAKYSGHYFRREFDIAGRIASARLYFAASGLLRNCLNRGTPQACRIAAGTVIPTINGASLSDRQLDSAPTSTKRALYSTLDVTRYLRQGRNVIGLSEGGDGDVLAQIEIKLVDGQTIVIGTDRRWTTHPSPSIHVDRFAGTTYDARLELPGWDTPAFHAQDPWPDVTDTPAEDRPQIVSSDATLPPMRVVKRLQPVAITKSGPDSYTFDFGQNISGRVHLDVPSAPGRVITITHSERLAEDGTADPYATGFMGLQTDNYTAAGTRSDWSETFSYYGFRYATITGLRAVPTTKDVRAEQVNTDLQPAGEFLTSDPMINRIHQAAVQTTLNNAHGIPEDCPHREKRGWTADGYVSDPQALANFDMAGFYRKWMQDIREAQRPNGAVPDVVPTEISYQKDGDSLWGLAAVAIPWDLYRETGDISVLRENYTTMKAFIDWAKGTANDFILPVGEFTGDWVSEKKTDDQLLRTGLWYIGVRQLSQSAALLGNREDARTYGKLADDIKLAFDRFREGETSTYGTPGKQAETTSQASFAIPLAAGLVPDGARQAVIARFIRYIEETNNFHIESGLNGTRYVLQALEEIGRQDIIDKMVGQPDAPGWAHMMTAGPGTLWEGWRSGSLDHAWPGSVDASFYRIYAGISSTAPGYREVTIAPFVPDHLEWVNAVKVTPYGKLVSRWRKDGGKLKMDVDIPVGISGTVVVPTRNGGKATALNVHDGKVAVVQREPGSVTYKVDPGHYRFESTGF